MLPMKSNCLSATLDALDDTYFWGQVLPDDEMLPVARWIAAQQDVLRLAPGVWRADQDTADLHLFTGERIRTRQAAGHILGVEACRALVRLRPTDAAIAEALGDAWQRIGHRCFASGCVKGECAHSAVAFWRLQAAQVGPASASQLAEGLRALAEHRDGKGRWRGFPFHYTLLALLELGSPEADEELRYAETTCRRLLDAAARSSGEEQPGVEPEDTYLRRQRALMERVLARHGN